MRKKVAKALRLEAELFASSPAGKEKGQEKNVYVDVKHPPKILQFGHLPELDSLGRLQPFNVTIVPITTVCAKGPRFLYRRMKKAFMRGQVMLRASWRDPRHPFKLAT